MKLKKYHFNFNNINLILSYLSSGWFFIGYINKKNMFTFLFSSLFIQIIFSIIPSKIGLISTIWKRAKIEEKLQAKLKDI